MPMPHTAKPDRRAFTLMELLVVILIIGVLMSLLFPIISIVRRNGQVTKTTTWMKNIETAVNRNHALNQVYPENGYLSYDTNNSDKLKDGITDSHEVDENEFLVNNQRLYTTLKDIDGDNINKHVPFVLEKTSDQGSHLCMVDAWGNPFNYRPFIHYPLIAQTDYKGTSDNGEVPAAHSDDPPRIDSFQIWSIGYDRLNQDGERADSETRSGADDIANW